MKSLAVAAFALLLLGGCCRCYKDCCAAGESDAQAVKGLRFRWVCESDHTVKRTGPYKDNYEDAEAGGRAHEEASHDGQSTIWIEESIGS